MPKTKEQKREEAIARKHTSDLRHYVRPVYSILPGGCDHQTLVGAEYSKEYVFSRTHLVLLPLKDKLNVDIRLRDFLFNITGIHGVGPVSLDRLISHLSEVKVIKWASENGVIIPFIPERQEAAILRMHASFKSYAEEFKQYLTTVRM